jgi:predicted metal-dependent hydrolase
MPPVCQRGMRSMRDRSTRKVFCRYLRNQILCLCRTKSLRRDVTKSKFLTRSQLDDVSEVIAQHLAVGSLGIHSRSWRPCNQRPMIHVR